ncbi:hypothetical protein VTO73DRAFT_2352 [Trametes versicolor]
MQEVASWLTNPADLPLPSPHDAASAGPPPERLPSPHLRDDDYAQPSAPAAEFLDQEDMDVDGSPAAAGQGPSATRLSVRAARDSFATVILPTAVRAREPSLPPATPARGTPLASGTLPSGGWGPSSGLTPIWDVQHSMRTAPTHRISPVLATTNSYTFTPTPVGVLDPERVVEMWKKNPDRILLFHVYNCSFPGPGQSRPMTDEITAMLKDDSKEDGFVVVAPEPVWLPRGAQRGTPKTWAVQGLSADYTRRLRERGVLSCDRITLLFYERALYIPRYLFTVHGYAHNVDNDIEETIKRTLSAEPNYSWVVEMVQSNANYAHLDPDEAATLVLSSVEVRVDRLNNGNLQAAIFCDTPTESGDRWVLWRHRLMGVPFRSFVNPTPTPRAIETCAGCHSADHVTHRCPFPDVHGWNAPLPGAGSYARPPATAQAAAAHTAPLGNPYPTANTWHAPQPAWQPSATRGTPARGGLGARGGRGRGRGRGVPQQNYLDSAYF